MNLRIQTGFILRKAFVTFFALLCDRLRRAIEMQTINILIILISHHWLPFLFNIEADALSLARHGILLGAAFSIFDGLYVVQNSIVKAW